MTDLERPEDATAAALDEMTRRGEVLPEDIERLSAAFQAALAVHGARTVKALRLTRTAIRRFVWAIGGIVLAFIAAFVLVAIGVHSQSDRIQAERFEASLQTCQLQDARYTNTAASLDALRQKELQSQPTAILQLLRAAGLRVADIQPLEQLERASIQSSYTSTLGLVRALDPFHSDCNAYARRLVKGEQLSTTPAAR